MELCLTYMLRLFQIDTHVPVFTTWQLEYANFINIRLPDGNAVTLLLHVYLIAMRSLYKERN